MTLAKESADEGAIRDTAPDATRGSNGLQEYLPPAAPVKRKKLSGGARRKLRSQQIAHILKPPMGGRCPESQADITAWSRWLSHVSAMAVIYPQLREHAAAAARAAFVGSLAEKSTYNQEQLARGAAIQALLEQRHQYGAGALVQAPDETQLLPFDIDEAAA